MLDLTFFRASHKLTALLQLSHANRTTITTDDVLLLVRRNEELENMLKGFIDSEKEKRAAVALGKRKR